MNSKSFKFKRLLIFLRVKSTIYCNCVKYRYTNMC